MGGVKQCQMAADQSNCMLEGKGARKKALLARALRPDGAGPSVRARSPSALPPLPPPSFAPALPLPTHTHSPCCSTVCSGVTADQSVALLTREREDRWQVQVAVGAV